MPLFLVDDCSSSIQPNEQKSAPQAGSAGSTKGKKFGDSYKTGKTVSSFVS